MKKIIFLLNLLFLLFPISVLAVSDVDYTITKYNIEANVESNGNVNVCEYIKLTGSFNGYVRDIFYKEGDTKYNPKSISNINVYNLDVDTMSKGSSFIYDDNALKGDILKYNIKENYNGPTVTMFNENISGSKGFVLCYTLENAVLVHNDVAELYYSFIPDGFEDLLEDVSVKVYLKDIDDSLRVWAHGPLYGNVSKEKTEFNSYLLANINYVNPGEIVAVRMTFDKKLVSDSIRFTNEDNLDKIIEEETVFADAANRERQIQRIIIYAVIGEFIIFVGFVIYSVIYCYIKYDKEHKVEFDMEYYRDFPNTYGPEILDYLIKHGNGSNSYSASILNMIYKKNIIIKETEDKKDYILTKAESFKEPLTVTEGIILDFIINDIGNGKEVYLKDIKNYGKTEKNALDFMKHFESWKHEVEKEALKYNFFEKNGASKFAIMVFIFTIVTFLTGLFNDVAFVSVLSLFIGMGAFVYILLIKKRTETGMLEYKKWMAFKKFLIDFGRFDEKELPSIILWEKYLVYATVFGIADSVEKTMKIKIDSMNTNSDYSDIFLTNYMIRNNFAHTINKTISNAYSASRSTIAASSSSSGSGGGGGFSGGGGGGGGGGGHGF